MRNDNNVFARTARVLGLSAEAIADRMRISVESVAEIESTPTGELADNLETVRAYVTAMGLGPAPRSADGVPPFSAAQLADLAFLGLLREVKAGVFCPSSALQIMFGNQPSGGQPSAPRLRLVSPPQGAGDWNE